MCKYTGGPGIRNAIGIGILCIHACLCVSLSLHPFWPPSPPRAMLSVEQKKKKKKEEEEEEEEQKKKKEERKRWERWDEFMESVCMAKNDVDVN